MRTAQNLKRHYAQLFATGCNLRSKEAMRHIVVYIPSGGDWTLEPSGGEAAAYNAELLDGYHLASGLDHKPRIYGQDPAVSGMDAQLAIARGILRVLE